MRILHVHQIAHIPQLLVRNLRQKGLDCEFTEKADPKTIKSFDMVHGHYALNRKTIDAFRLARRNRIPFIIHCHGSDLRLLTGTGRTGLPFHYRLVSEYIRNRSAKILLSTPDLIKFEPRGEYVPNPVDLEKFFPMPGAKKTGRTLICGKQVKGSKLLNFIKPDIEYDCVNTGHSFEFPDNVRILPYVDYSVFNEFLNMYESMIGTIGDLISMARLEAMACGLKTFTNFDARFAQFYNGHNPDTAADPRKFITDFHRPVIAVEKLLTVYDGIKP